MDSKEGKKVLTQANIELDEMNKLEEASKGFDSFEDFIMFVKDKGLVLNHKNMGYLPYLKIFNDLKLPNFFKQISKDSKLEYKYSDMVFSGRAGGE